MTGPVVHFPVEAVIDFDGNSQLFEVCGCDPRYEYPMGHEDFEDDSFSRLLENHRLEDLPPF
jgi:hypothetical protein